MTDDAGGDAVDADELARVLHQQAQNVQQLADQQQRIMDLLEAVVAEMDDDDLEQRLADAVGDVLAPDAGPADPDDDDGDDPGRRMFR